MHIKNSGIKIMEKNLKILYEPKEGTTGFWGLIDCPATIDRFCDEKHICDNTDGKHCADYSKYCRFKHNAALESCKEKKLEIYNPEECFTYGPYAINGSNEVIKFKEGEIFDLPIGYEFKEETILSGGWVPTYNNPDNNGLEESAEPMQVLRLVKTETKERKPSNELVGSRLLEYVPQPEPEESQTWTDIYNLGQKHGVQNYIAILSSEIEKELNQTTAEHDYYNGIRDGYKYVLELIFSVIPKK